MPGFDMIRSIESGGEAGTLASTCGLQAGKVMDACVAVLQRETRRDLSSIQPQGDYQLRRPCMHAPRPALSIDLFTKVYGGKIFTTSTRHSLRNKWTLVCTTHVHT